MFEATIPLAEGPPLLTLFGTRDQHLRLIQQALGVQISHRRGEIRVAGEQAAVVQATQILESLKDRVERAEEITTDDVSRLLPLPPGSETIPDHEPADLLSAGRKIRPRTAGQARYMTAIRQHDVVFAVGPAGTGKTYLAVAMAVEAFKHKLFKKIVLCRPAVAEPCFGGNREFHHQ